MCRDADADLSIVAGDMWGDLTTEICALIDEKKERENVVLLLGTFGGSPDVAYKIARVLQSEYSHFKVVVDTYCKSAGTLIVLGASELVISNRGELGPLDIQVGGLEEPKERTSGLAPVQALTILREQVAETCVNLFNTLSTRLPVRTRVAVSTAEAITSRLFCKLYQQLEPIRLGEYQRAMSLMTEYAERLRQGGKNVKPGAIHKLVTQYPDHNFVIDRTEAADLFQHVRSPNLVERTLLKHLENLFDHHLFSKMPALIHYFAVPTGDADVQQTPDARPAGSDDSVRDFDGGGRTRETGTRLETRQPAPSTPHATGPAGNN